MSGAFETAAGAFAVVGVADVVFRTGREIYKFLGEVADAPKELVVLREVMTEFLLLDKPLRKCLGDLKNQSSTVISSDAVPPLESAMKALDSELKNLKSQVAKLKGSKTWSSVKFVLDKSKVDKLTNKLESAKTYLAIVLNIANR
jgi:hypothetical protein